MPSGAALDRLLVVGGCVLLLIGVVLLVDDSRSDTGSNPVTPGDGEAAAVPMPGDSPTADESRGATPVPSDEPPGSDQPSPASPSPAETALSPRPTEVPVETAEVFFALWLDALTNGETAPLLARLHPVVLEAYGEQQCATYLDSVVELDVDVRVVGEEDLPGYVLDVDDLGLEVDEPTSRVALVRQDGDGEPYETAATLATMPDGTRAWFTDCGTPR